MRKQEFYFLLEECLGLWAMRRFYNTEGNCSNFNCSIVWCSTFSSWKWKKIEMIFFNKKDFDFPKERQECRFLSPMKTKLHGAWNPLIAQTIPWRGNEFFSDNSEVFACPHVFSLSMSHNFHIGSSLYMTEQMFQTT